MRKTKIICTLGPATEKTETLRGLLNAGADIFRLNMSHAEHQSAGRPRESAAVDGERSRGHRAGVELNVDFVALSFARKKSDLQELRRVLKKAKSRAQVVAKIEDQSAVRHIGQMIETADVVMIARGDLGIECPMEELPIIQRRIVKRCLRIGKPVIVATHMLESMIENPVPTRAEITDVANAVFEQADAIMLSGDRKSTRLNSS